MLFYFYNEKKERNENKKKIDAIKINYYKYIHNNKIMYHFKNKEKRSYPTK